MKNKKIAVTAALISALALVAGGQAFAAEENSLPTEDRAGNAITVPEEITKVISMAPSTSEILDELGLTDLLVAVDTYTPNSVPETAELPQFDMMTPDCEAILEMAPDIVFVTGMSYVGAEDPYAELVTAGVCVVQIPSSTSIAAIEEDIQFVSDCFGMSEEGAAIVDNMQAKIDEIAAIGETITEKKTVMFETSALPYIYSFGSGVFLNEMLEIIGAENVFADQESWISVTEESALAANPDVILTSVDYIEDPVGEILAREGWEEVEAVKNGAVYSIDSNASNQPNHNIVIALEQMAKAVYPEEYAMIGESETEAVETEIAETEAAETGTEAE